MTVGLTEQFQSPDLEAILPIYIARELQINRKIGARRYKELYCEIYLHIILQYYLTIFFQFSNLEIETQRI